MNRKRLSPATLKRQCEEFNATNSVGTTVLVTLDDGTLTEMVTTHPAEVTDGGHAVIWLSGIRGCYLLDRVKPQAVPA